MIGMGMSLRPVDFRRVVVYPKAALVGLFGQLIFLPAVGFLIVYLYPLRPEMAVGIMVLAACPGGTTSNLITHMARGNVALSVTLTAISGTVTVFSIPYLVNLALAVFMPAADPEQQVQLPVLETIGTLVLIVLVPTIIGMLIRRRAPDFADRQEKYVRIASGAFLVILIVGLIIKERAILVDAFIDSGPAGLILNLAALIAGYSMARLARLDDRQVTSIMIEVGIQNGTLGILIGTSILNMPDVAIPPAIYSLIMYMTGGFIVYWRHGLHSAAEAEEAERAEAAL
ncbi:MAG: bile acid:sodium symporter family protein [Leptospiraceae bacterium]|nr:bile acid:sodium symporter family protein [Leptospiraceae bacterium]